MIWSFYPWALDLPPLYETQSRTWYTNMQSAGITSALLIKRRESIRVLECLVFMRRDTQGVTEGPLICGQYWLPSFIQFARNHSWAGTNGANWGSDRTNSHWPVSHVGGRILLMFSTSSDLHGGRFANIWLSISISTIKLHISDLNSQQQLNVIWSGFCFNTYRLKYNQDSWGSYFSSGFHLLISL